MGDNRYPKKGYARKVNKGSYVSSRGTCKWIETEDGWYYLFVKENKVTHRAALGEPEVPSTMSVTRFLKIHDSGEES